MALSILAIINALSPKERGSRQLARDIAYGNVARQKLDIYAPKEKSSAPRPTLFFIYGGSWSDGDKNSYTFVGRALANLGYVVVIADYRLLPEVEYPAFLQDCALAFAWAVANIASFGGDPERMAVLGHSAGAYNAMMLLLDPAYLQKQGHLQRVKAGVGLSGPYDFYPFDSPITRRTFGAVPDPERTQPVNLVTANAPPMLLAHGDADGLVYPRNTVALAQRLCAAGVEVVEKHYQGVGHPMTLMPLGKVFRKRVPVLADIAAFLTRKL